MDFNKWNLVRKLRQFQESTKSSIFDFLILNIKNLGWRLSIGVISEYSNLEGIALPDLHQNWHPGVELDAESREMVKFGVR